MLDKTRENKLFWAPGTLFLLCILALIFYACSGGGGVDPVPDPVPDPLPETIPQWTIMSYVDGNNNLDSGDLGASFYFRKVQDMEQIGSTDDVKIVTMLSTLKEGCTAKYYHVEKHPDEMSDTISSTVLKDVGTVDMSDPDTLKKFVNYVLDQKEYQADHYMLVIADHGYGWHGICWDDSQGMNGRITMNELNEALTDIDIKFDIIAFDACLMGMVEVAYEIADFADYMVASQNVTWATIDLGYPEWLEKLVIDPDMDPKTLSENVAKAIYNEGVYSDKDVTTSVIDLSKIQHLCSGLKTFATDLILSASDNNTLSRIKTARENCHEEQDEPDFIDLKQFAGEIKNAGAFSDKVLEEADELMDSINDACIFHDGNVQYARNGISIYFPRLENHYSEANKTDYKSISFSETNWHSFIEVYIDIFGDDGGDDGGGMYSSLSGTVVWPDHNLPNNTIAFLDSSGYSTIEAQVLVDSATGAYVFDLSLDIPLKVLVVAFVDDDGDGIWEEGENTFGWYDKNGDGSPSTDDMVTINPGDTITGTNIVLYSWE